MQSNQINPNSSFTNSYNQYGIANNSNNSNQSYGQSISPNAFHTANYRGDQMGHDNYLRSDSSTPAQQQAFNYQGFNSQGQNQAQNYTSGMSNSGQNYGNNSGY
ncbi:hypothetical protein D3C73_894970 [compost metagenome]